MSGQLLLSQSYQMGSLLHDDSIRTFRVFLPGSYEEGQQLPLVINMHGLGSSDVEQILYSGIDGIADTAGFIVVYPQGIELFFNGQTTSHWNAGFGTGIDDLGFIDKLIDRMYTDYQIDLSRVYATGMSNGGFMSYHLACQLSDRIAAIASVTGAITLFDIANCATERPVPVMQIHGTADPTVPYGGSDLFTPSIPDVVNFWVAQNGCEQEPDTTFLTDIDTTDASTASRLVYGACNDSVEVHFYIIEGGGHSWPGAIPIPGLNPTNQDFSASQVIWEFFSQYTHPNPAAGTILSADEAISAGELIQVFPNPFSDILHLQVHDHSIRRLSIRDIHGRLLWKQDHLLPNQSLELEIPSTWPEGMYVLQIETDRGSFVQKLVRDKR